MGTVANGLGRLHIQDPCAVSEESRMCGTCFQGWVHNRPWWTATTTGHLHDRTPGPEVFSLSDDQPLAPEPDQVADEGTPSVLVSCDAARTWPRQQSAPIPIGNRFAELAQEEILEPGREIHVADVSDTETCGEVDQPSRRLRLVWRQTQVDSCPGPDSHDQRKSGARVRRAMHREARDRVVHAATEFLILVVDRVGHVDPGGESRERCVVCSGRMTKIAQFWSG